MRPFSRFARWPPIVKALTVIWLSWLAAGAALIFASVWLNEAMHESAKLRAWQDLNAIASVAHDEVEALHSEGSKPTGELSHRFLRIQNNLSRLSGMHLSLVDAQGHEVAAGSMPGDQRALAEILFELNGGNWKHQLEVRVPSGKFFVAFRPIGESFDGPAQYGVVVWGEHDRLLAGFHAQRRQLIAGAAGLVLMLLVMTALLSAYVHNKLSLSAELERREAKLAASEALLLDAQKLAKIGSWEMGTTPESFVATPGYYEIYQIDSTTVPRSNEEFIARFLVDPEDIRQARANLPALAIGTPTHGIRHVRLADGTRKWIEFQVIPRLDASGKKIGSRGIVRDITAERAAVAAMALRTAQLEQAKEISGLGTWSMSVPDGKLITCAQMMRIYGTTAENTPQTMAEWGERFLPEEDKAEFRRQLAANFNIQPFERERRIIVEGGIERWIRTIAKPEFDDVGLLVRYNGITLDITPAKRTMLALASRTAQLERALLLGRMGSWIWHLESDQVEFSAQHRAIYGLPPDTPGQTMCEWIEQFSQPAERHAAESRLAAARNGVTLDDVRRVHDAQGRPMWIHVVAEPVRDRQGRVTMVTGITRDITEEKQREEELVETARLLGESQRIARLGHFYWDIASDRIQPFGQYDQVFGLTDQQRFDTMTEWYDNYCHPEDRFAADSNQTRNIEQGVGYQIQRRSRMPDGSYRWIEVSGEPVRDAHGKLVGYRGVARDIHDAKVAQLQLSESEARFRLISENMHDHVALHDPSGRVLYSSPSTRTLLGYSASRSVGLDPYGQVHPDDQVWVREHIGAFMASGATEPLRLEHRFRHRDGHYIWLETIIVPVRDTEGKLLHFQSSSRDVTARRQAEQQLRESEERFRTLTEVSSDWYWETDAAHRFSFVSAEERPEYSTQPRNALGKTRWELFPEGMTDAGWAQHRELLDHCEPFTGVVLRMQNADGLTTFASISGRPRFDEHGEFLGYRGTGRDITRIKRAEQKLAESEQRFRLIANNMQDIVSLHELSGKVAFLSPSFESVTGHSGGAARRTVRDLIHPAERRSVLQTFGAIARSAGESATVTARVRHADGRYLWVEAHITRVAGQDGRPQVQVMSRDVTRRREAERQLERRTAELARTNRQLGVEVQQRQELERNVLMTIEMELARVGLELHDQLGQDLTGISLMAKTLERRLSEKNPDVAANALRISELVNNTIRHTRMISHGLSPYIWGSNGLAAALSQLAADIQALGVVEIQTRIEPEVGIRDELVARNLYRIAQEASNNALKHSRATQVTIDLSRRGSAVVLKVSDDGIGSLAGETATVPAESRFHSIRHRCSVIGAELSIRHPRRGGTVLKIQWQNPAADNEQPDGQLATAGEGKA
jgi:PAS domain S-box-containing protein